MELTKQEVRYWGECPTEIDEAYRWIERAGRICYQSQDKITDDSARPFVQRVMKAKHSTVIEQSNFVIRRKQRSFPETARNAYRNSFYSRYLDFEVEQNRVFIGGNYRAWLEMLQKTGRGITTIEDLFDFFGNYTNLDIITDHNEIPMSLKRVTVEYITDRAVLAEFTRHRPASFLVQSQRYCMVTGDLVCIVPYQFEDYDEETADDVTIARYRNFVQAMEYAETAYKRDVRLLDQQCVKGAKAAEQARAVLPNQTAVNMVVTASIPEWQHIFKLRTSLAAYPQFRRIMNITRDIFDESGFTQ